MRTKIYPHKQLLLQQLLQQLTVEIIQIQTTTL